MPNRFVRDVLVVGLGPAGSATAIRLARQGLDVVAIDRARFPRDKICSEYLSPEAVRHLSEIGVLSQVEPHAARLDGATVIGPNGARVSGLFAQASPTPFRPSGISVARWHLDRVLAQAAHEAGTEVWEETSLVSLERTVAGQLVTVRRAGRLETIEARVVIGADGLRSLVARSLGGRATRWLKRYGFVAHVAAVDGISSTAEMHVGRDGYVGLNAIGGDVTNVAVVVPAGRAARAAGDPTRFWHQTLEAFPGVAGRVRVDNVVRPVLVSGPFAARSREVIGDGLALVGDAADFFDPFTGEGICAALRGAEMLAPVVATAIEQTGPVTRERLAPYRAARRTQFRGKWMVERMIGYGMLWPALFDRAVDRLGRRDLGHTLIGVTGDFVPPKAVLRPSFLAAMVV